MTEPKPCCHDSFSVCDVLERKAIKGVVLADLHMTVRDAAALMLSVGVGSLLVMEGPRHVGIITEREMVRVVRDADDAATQLVRNATNRDVYCCGDDVSVDEVSELMRVRQVRHMPVVDANENSLGVVSIGDINAHRVGQCAGILLALFALAQLLVMSRAPWLEQVHGLDGVTRVHHRFGQAFFVPLIEAGT